SVPRTSSSTTVTTPLERSLSITPSGSLMPSPPRRSSATAVRACSAVVSVTALSWARTAAAASSPGPSDSHTRGHSSTTQSEKDAESGSTVTPASAAALSTASANRARPAQAVQSRDRKSTRLNSSHVSISYAVFCLKKKKLQHNEK